MKSISFTFLFLLSIFIQAQNSSDTDSLFSKSEDLLYQKPSESAKIAQFLFENSTQENDKIKSLLILTESNLIRGDYSTAIEKLFQAWELSSYSKNSKNKTKINSLINRICSKLGIDQRQLYLISDNLGKNDSAESYTQKVKDIEPYSSFLKSKNLFSEGNFNQSIEALNNLKPFNKIQDVQLREEIYILNARNYKEIKDWKQYQIHYNLQNALHDSVSILKENARILFITKINQKQDAILEMKSENQTRIMYVVVGIIFIVFTIGYLWNRKLNFRKNNFERLIKEKEEKIKLEAENKVQEGAGKIVIPDKTIHALLSKLEEFEQNEDYLDPSMSLNVLSENLNTNTKYLSEIINTHKNKNFHSYINELRVNYIIGKLRNNPVYLKYKVSHLAEEAGFSSHSLFSTVFKQVTGLSPAAYTKLITKDESK
ncbi:helix-turn-helix domain-containing protein [Moheibacter sediminis]|uniref:AraC-type DNA-binding protein n=1 Tax=Moheibacter sediminis TaxID=1434700 RepID=A0A1W2CFM6_9FLAO|nr:helix-turn-helix domain-containing protein [Moheibacter sediminis]SMC84057.1 AraC-type DNA-binding protein [Moheibacter sediminis]